MTFHRRTLAFLSIAALSAACASASISPAPTASPAASSQRSAVASASVSPASASPSLEATTPSPAAIASPAASAATPPPKPEDVTFDLINETPHDEGTTTLEYRITWSSPAGVATSFRLYGVTGCLREGKKYDGKPCVVRGMKIPSDALELIKTVPGDKRTTTITWNVGEIGGGPYAAILIRATNAAGNSIFTIVQSENVCFQCVY
jgi:hypothetical protein